jgi:hypothetical protein
MSRTLHLLIVAGERPISMKVAPVADELRRRADRHNTGSDASTRWDIAFKDERGRVTQMRTAARLPVS